MTSEASTSSIQVGPIPFDESDARSEHELWGCNCGPAALAAILGKPLYAMRGIAREVGFIERGYMNVTMMREAIALAGGRIVVASKVSQPTYQAFAFHGLVRIQWTGPWIIDGKPARWAATATHWIASWRIGAECWVFDINGGLRRYDLWISEIVPAIVASIKRADGGWYPTHSWEIDKAEIDKA